MTTADTNALTTRDFETIEVAEADDDVLLVTLNRPERLNAITATMIDELNEVISAVDRDPELRAVVLTGAGRGFSAGLDLQGSGTAPGAWSTGPWRRHGSSARTTRSARG